MLCYSKVHPTLQRGRLRACCALSSTHSSRDLWAASSVLVNLIMTSDICQRSFKWGHFQKILISWNKICFKSSHTQYSKVKIHFAHLNSDTKAGAAGDGAGEEKTDLLSLQKAALCGKPRVQTSPPERGEQSVFTPVILRKMSLPEEAKCKVKAHQEGPSWPRLGHLRAGL